MRKSPRRWVSRRADGTSSWRGRRGSCFSEQSGLFILVDQARAALDVARGCRLRPARRGAATLLLIAVFTRTPLPRNLKTWGHLFVLSALLNSVPFTLFAYGETHISAVLAGLINAFTPLATVIVAVFILRQEPYSSTVIGGLVVGLIGVVVVIGAWNGFGKSQLLGIGACLVAVICYGFGFSYARGHLGRLPDKPVALATGQVCAGPCSCCPFPSCSATSRHIARCRRSWPWVPSVSSHRRRLHT